MRSLELSFFATREMAIEVGHHRNCQYCRHNCHHHHNMFLCNQADGHRGGICCRSSASLSYFMIVIRIFHHCHNYHHHLNYYHHCHHNYFLNLYHPHQFFDIATHQIKLTSQNNLGARWWWSRGLRLPSWFWWWWWWLPSCWWFWWWWWWIPLWWWW